MEKKKVLVFYKQLDDDYCRAIENIGMQPISFFSEEGSFEDFKITPYLKYKNILRRLFFGDKLFLQREYKKYTESQLVRRIKQIAHQYSKIDYALFFRGDYYPDKVIDVSRSISEKMITYQFDGMSVCQDLLPNKNKFDRIFTFNQEDMDTYHFLPLTNCWFPDEKKIDNPKIEKDLFYVGVGTPDRIDKAKRLGEYCSENNLLPDMLLTVPPHISEENGGVNLSHSGISYKENLEKLQYAKAIVDMKLEYHNGLSYRFFEALYYEKKIITDNVNVKNYDFYHPDNIFVTDYNHFEGLKEFLEKPYHTIDKNIVDKYGVENWLRYVLDIEPYQAIDLPPLWKEK